MNTNLPSLKQNLRKMADDIFTLLCENASAGTAKGDNQELLTMLFKVRLRLWATLYFGILLSVIPSNFDLICKC